MRWNMFQEKVRCAHCATTFKLQGCLQRCNKCLLLPGEAEVQERSSQRSEDIRISSGVWMKRKGYKPSDQSMLSWHVSLCQCVLEECFWFGLKRPCLRMRGLVSRLSDDRCTIESLTWACFGPWRAKWRCNKRKIDVPCHLPFPEYSDFPRPVLGKRRLVVCTDGVGRKTRGRSSDIGLARTVLKNTGSRDFIIPDLGDQGGHLGARSGT
ncbi:hypothetical protein BXZ70DRAFT_596076 [Cristinia sonorae]|uniref:Uncharacterized protein n=1 Tax=Cristinia sonorae TaxID=1940300 RepID=A0A8K0UUA6_9AGAR|nr:hypothetical protein BXZ70DRAFT_596076 [Cristinia sonorae]